MTLPNETSASVQTSGTAGVDAGTRSLQKRLAWRSTLQAIGTNLASKQLNRNNIIVTAVLGAPDIEAALKDAGNPMIQASSSQDPYAMAQLAVRLGNDAMNGKKPENTVTLMPSKLITRENVGQYQGWSAPRS